MGVGETVAVPVLCARARVAGRRGRGRNKRGSTKVEQSSLLINSLIKSLAPRAAAGAELESYL
eukprot:SAG31_NODE_25672_length_456_cov_10.372549_1_plen_62_part_10